MFPGESIVFSALQKIAELAYREAVFLHGVRKEVEKIQRELGRMQAFLRVAEQKQKECDDRVEHLVVDLTDVAFDAQDEIERYILRSERNSRRGPMRRFLSLPNDWRTLHKIGNRIEEINTELDKISKSKSTYGIPDINRGEGPSSPHRRLQAYRRNAALAEDDDVVGFEKDVNTLVGRLTKGQPRRCVVSLVGMGGAGKTTVARKVYNHQHVKTHFRGSVAWVCVSQNYQVKGLLQDIAEQVMNMQKDESNQLSENVLQERLSGFLRKKRNLIVLDDIWDIEAWEQLIAAFPDGQNGSRIMFTTRNAEEVAVRADPDPENRPHELPLLNSEESWKLFLKRVFPWKKGDQTSSCPLELVELGKKIVAKCGGLPLAIVVIGGLLSAKETPRSWQNVLDSLPWQLSEQESVHCSDILALSYYDLPNYLKPCFLYVGFFPEDEEIEIEKLMGLWVAEGFIQERGQQIKEEVAFDCLLELIGRSMIQMAKREFDGSIRTCRIHDLLLDLAIAEANRDHFFKIDSDGSTATSFNRARRLAIHHETTGDRYKSLNHTNPKLRSLLCFTKSLPPKLDVGGAKFLRVLHLDKRIDVGNDWIARVLGNLLHLKHFKLTSFNEPTIIPESIGKLHNLETLIVDCSFSVHFPKAIWKMHRLRHLKILTFFSGECVFKGHPELNDLTNLRTLCLDAGSWIKKETISKFASLRVLKVNGDLSPYGEILSYSIEKLKKLQSLQLIDTSEKLVLTIPTLMHHVDLREMYLGVRLEKLLDVLEFPPNLTELRLIYSPLKEDPIPTLEKLETLQILEISSGTYRGKKLISSAQGFPRLKSLALFRLSTVDEWIVEETALPALISLTIEYCQGIKMLPEGLRGVTTLREMTINGMPADFTRRLLQREGGIGGEDLYKIPHVSSLTLDRSARG